MNEKSKLIIIEIVGQKSSQKKSPREKRMCEMDEDFVDKAAFLTPPVLVYFLIVSLVFGEILDFSQKLLSSNTSSSS